MDNSKLIYGVALMIVLVLVKVILHKVIDETDARKLWLYGLSLFVIYAAAMGGAIYVFCADAGSIQECLGRVLVTFLVGNVIALIPGVLCYCVKGRRGISQMDRMKLKDM